MREQIKAFKRSRIIETASKLFFERGYEATSVESLATELGVTKPFIYSYFQNKRAILEAVHQQAAERIVSYIDQATSAGHASDEALSEFIRLFVFENIRNQVASGVFLQEEKHLSDNTLNTVRSLEREVNKKLTALIQEGIDQGLFHITDARIASMGISGMVRWVHRWYQRGGRHAPETIAQQMADLGLNMVRFNHPPVPRVPADNLADDGEHQ